MGMGEGEGGRRGRGGGEAEKGGKYIIMKVLSKISPPPQRCRGHGLTMFCSVGGRKLQEALRKHLSGQENERERVSWVQEPFLTLFHCASEAFKWLMRCCFLLSRLNPFLVFGPLIFKGGRIFYYSL